MSSQVISTDNATVVIQINPQMVQDSGDGEEDKRGPYHNAVLKGFLKVQAKALGTVQIMIGVMIFLLGIVLTIKMKYFHFTVSGITFWGSLIYISAGSLSVVAENKLHPCVVKASLGMNVISAITAGIAIILMSVQFSFMGMCFYHSNYRSDYDRYNYVCFDIEVLGRGIVIVLMVFSILQFIISICISAFACKATCATDSSVVNVSLHQRR